ncbi:MAG: acyltransferase family protein [Sphingobium sp.]
MKFSASDNATSAGFSSINRENSFDTLRLISALFVLLGHAFFLTGQNAPQIIGIPIHTLGLLNLFVISGYLTTLSWVRNPAFFKYVAKRSLRIFPGLLASLLFIALVIGPLFTSYSLQSYFSNRYTILFVVRNFALWFDDWLPGVFDGPQFGGGSDGVLWTLPIEFGLYFTVPILVALASWNRRVAGISIMAAAVALTWLSMISNYEFHHRIYRINIDSALEIVPFFFFGAGIAMATNSSWISRHSIKIGAFCALILCLAGFAPPNWNYVLGLPLLSSCIVSVGLSRLLYSGSYSRIGDLSYGIYLIHWPIESAILSVIGFSVSAWVLGLIATGLCIPYAWCLWHGVERPALALKQRLRSKLQTHEVVEAPHLS